MAAARLGFRAHIFSPETDGPASQVAAFNTVADYTDRDALRRFAEAVDVITFEFENIPADSLAAAGEPAPGASECRRSSRSARTVCWKNSF